jgi:hypothetical protein
MNDDARNHEREDWRKCLFLPLNNKAGNGVLVVRYRELTLAAVEVCSSYFGCCNILPISEIFAKSNFSIICGKFYGLHGAVYCANYTVLRIKMAGHRKCQTYFYMFLI